MKLFNRLRQTLIREGNIKRYFFYAIGEIFLVMIGISLAFQLDNWNNDRIMRNSEKIYYQSIKSQITDDKDLILSQEKYNRLYMAQFEYANKLIEKNDRSQLDTLGIIISNLSKYSDFDRQGNIYETMVNSGQRSLLKNQKIVDGIRELEEMYIYINRMENIHYDAVMQHVVKMITPVLKYATMEIKKPEKIFTYEFQNLIIILIQVMEEKDRTYQQALNEIDEVTKMIDQELGIE